MTFEEDERASSQPPAPTPPAAAQPPTPTPTPPSAFPSVSHLSWADRVAVIRAQVDALVEVSPRELGGAGALELFDGVFELSDRLRRRRACRG